MWIRKEVLRCKVCRVRVFCLFMLLMIRLVLSFLRKGLEGFSYVGEEFIGGYGIVLRDDRLVVWDELFG